MGDHFRLVSEENVNIGTLRLYVKSTAPDHSAMQRGMATQVAMGANIHGRVGMRLNRASGVFIKGIWVKLKMTSTLRNKNPAIEKALHNNNVVDHLEQEEDHVAGGLYHVLLGVCSDLSGVTSLGVREAARERQRSVAAACEFVELRPLDEGIDREHTWDFHFTLPDTCPLSYIDELAETLCSLTAVVDSPVISKALSQTTHYLNVNSARTILSTQVRTSNPTSSTGPPSIKKEENGIATSTSWFNVCGIRSDSKYSFSLSTPAPDGFQVTVPQESEQSHPLSLPVCCAFPSSLQKKNKETTKENRFQLKIRVVKECTYGKRKSKSIRTYRHTLWSNVIEVEQGTHRAEFSVPLTVDLSELSANLNTWPRPMVNEGGAYSHAASPNSSPGSTATNTSNGSSRIHQSINCCSMDTSVYSIKYALVVDLYQMSKSRPLSSMSKEIRVLPPEMGCSDNFSRECIQNEVTGARPPLHSLTNQSARKILTPMAKLAVPRVEAEIISRGSAAVIMDRMREASIGLCDATPEQFVIMRRVAANDAVVIVNSNAEFSPANALLCTPSALGQSSNLTGNALLTPRVIFAESPRPVDSHDSGAVALAETNNTYY